MLFLLLLDYHNVKIDNLKRRIGIIKVPKQDEDTGNLQILLHLRSLFWQHEITFAIIPFAMHLHTINFFCFK